MRYLLALFLVMISAPALGDSEARQGADWVRITALPCSDATVLEHLTAASENPLDYRAARAEFQGAPYMACWKPLFDARTIFLQYSDGDQGLVPFTDLKPMRDV